MNVHNEYSDLTILMLTSSNVHITYELIFRSVKIASKFKRFSVYRENRLSCFVFIVNIVYCCLRVSVLPCILSYSVCILSYRALILSFRVCILSYHECIISYRLSCQD
jgi:hypothetical protein